MLSKQFWKSVLDFFLCIAIWRLGENGIFGDFRLMTINIQYSDLTSSTARYREPFGQEKVALQDPSEERCKSFWR